MAASFTIGGQRFYRRSLIRLNGAARATLRTEGAVTVPFPVEYPLEEFAPHFEDAYVDEGGTDFWGPGPYLKVPGDLREPTDDSSRAVHRIFCPWGSPPDRLRIAHRAQYVWLERVDLAQVDGTWTWLLTVAVAPQQTPARKR
jgi:hypothetical protein